jgi:hypothetical protein
LLPPNRSLPFELEPPVVPVFDLHPTALAREIGPIQLLRDDAFELMLAHRLPQRPAVVEGVWDAPMRPREVECLKDPPTLAIGLPRNVTPVDAE